MSFRPGQVVQLRRNLNEGDRAGYLYYIDEISPVGRITLESILPNTRRPLVLMNDTQTRDRILGITDFDARNVLAGKYELRGSYESGFFVALAETKPKKPIIYIAPEVLSKAFKYIPVKVGDNKVFYHNGNIVFRRKLEKPAKKRKKSIYDKFSKPKPFVKRVDLMPIDIKEACTYFSEESLFSECTFKIKDYRKSAKLFFNTESKKVMVDQSVKPSKIEFQCTCKRSDSLENTVTIKVGDRNLRFSLDDIEITYPNVNGWNKAKDRTIRVGSKVRLLRNKELRNMNKGDTVLVKNIKTVGHKTFIGFEHKDKKTVGRMKDFKLID